MENDQQKLTYFPLFWQTVVMFLCGWLVMVTLIPVILSVNPGVEVKITDKGMEYGEQTCFCFCPCPQVSSCGSSNVSFLQGDNWESLQYRKNSRKSKSRTFQGNREFLQSEKSNTAWQSKEMISIADLVLPLKCLDKYLLFQYTDSECWTADRSDSTGAWKWSQTLHKQCFPKSAWKLEGQVPPKDVNMISLLYATAESMSPGSLCSDASSLWTVRKAALSRWAWTTCPSPKSLPSRATVPAVLKSAAPAVRPLWAGSELNSAVERG